MRGGRGYQAFPSKTFGLTVLKNFVGKPFSGSLPSGDEKVWIREGGLSRFSVANYFSQCGKIPWVEGIL